MSTIELNCLIHGDTPDITNIFSVKFDSETIVNRLRDIIKEKIKEMKQDLPWVDDVIKLKLWKKLNILFDNPNVDIKRKFGGKKLFIPVDKIAKYFPYKLNKEYIHTIVELPGYHLTLTSCVKRNEIVPMYKIIYREGPLDLEGDRKILSIPDKVIIRKLFLVESAFLKKFQRKEIFAISFGLVDRREAIIVTIGLPKGSLLRFYLLSIYEGFPVIINYGVAIPFHRNYHEKFRPGISIGCFKNPPNACILGLLVQAKPESADTGTGSKIAKESNIATGSEITTESKIAKGSKIATKLKMATGSKSRSSFYILTAKHGIEKKGMLISFKFCATVTKYCILKVDNDGLLIDYAFCKISNNNSALADSNRIYRTEITISGFKTSVSNDPNNVICVKKVSRSIFFMERTMKDEWVNIKSLAFDPPMILVGFFMKGLLTS
ncbi:13677_t:CDS:2 [Dentiscutata erythropus]|uniref:13677_t:CDS:1 n=1 Tax=Dentiscutata erythropus TaxID=1348616 RepID=A0A9N9F1R5_9GLOM|nr:13677_t:CDS:2 [Dentiscutata erythropus]